MGTNFQLIRDLKNYFFSKSDNNTIGGHVFVDEDGVYDLGSNTMKFRAVYADSLVGTPAGSDELVKVDSADGTPGYLEDKLAADSPLTLTKTGSTDKLYTVSIDDSAYLHSDGSVALTGSLIVNSGVTIDGVDLSVFKDAYDIHIVTPNAHHDPVTEGNGIDVSGQVVSVGLATNSALSFSVGGLMVDNSLAGDGLIMSSGVMEINDGVGLEIVSDILRIHLWGVGGSGASDSGLVMDNDGLRVATAIAGSGLAIQNDPRVLSVNVKEGVEIDADSVRVDEDYAFVWTAKHEFNAGLYSLFAELANTEYASRVTSVDNGMLYFDKNITASADLFDVGGVTYDTNRMRDGNSGGMVLYNPDDGWGLVFDTRNMWAINAGFNTTTTLQVLSTANLLIDPTGSIYSPNNQVWRSNTFKDLWVGIEGWRIWQRESDNKNQLTIGAIKADELHVKVFSADDTMVQRGTEIMSRTFGEVAREFIWPAAGSTVDVWFKDSPAISGPIFLNNGVGVDIVFDDREWAISRTIDMTTGLIVSTLWIHVAQLVDEEYTPEDDENYIGVWATSIGYNALDIVKVGASTYYECIITHTSSSDTQPATGSLWASYWNEVTAKDWQKWRIRNQGGGTPGQVIKPGTTFVGVGSNNNPSPFIERSVLDVDNGPYMQMGDWSSDPRVISNWNITTRYGNLNGYAGFLSDTMGMFIGEGFTDADFTAWKGLIFSEGAGISLYNTYLSLYDSGKLRGLIQPDGNFYFGNNGVLDVTSSTASIYHNASTGALRLGTSTGPNILWDGTTLFTLSKVRLVFNDGTYNRGIVYESGSFFFGGTSAASVTSYNSSLSHFAADGIVVGSPPNETTYDRGDVRIGSQAGANILWDASAGKLMFRYQSETEQAYIDTDGTITAGGGTVKLSAIGLQILDGSSNSRLLARPDGRFHLGRNVNATGVGSASETSFFYSSVAIANYKESGYAIAAGDVVIGNWVAAHVFWDYDVGELQFRYGNTKQAYVSSTDGSITAGGGVVKLNSTGVNITAQSDGPSWDLQIQNSLTFKDSTGTDTYLKLGALEHTGNNLYGAVLHVPWKTGGGAGIILRTGYSSTREDQFRFSGGEMSIIQNVGSGDEFVFGFGLNPADSNNQWMYAWPDYDAYFLFGKATIGYIGWADNAAFAHNDFFTTSSHAFRQNNSGATFVNTASGQSVSLRVNNAERFLLDNTTITLKPSGTTVLTAVNNLLTAGVSINMGDNHIYGLYSTKFLSHSTAPTTSATEVALWSNSSDSLPRWRKASNGENLEVFGWGFSKTFSCGNGSYVNVLYVGSNYYIGTLYIDGTSGTSEQAGVAYYRCYYQGGTRTFNDDSIANSNNWLVDYSAGYIRIRQNSGALVNAKVVWTGTPNTAA